GDLVRSEIVPVIVALPPGERLLLPAGSVWHFWNQEGPPPGDWQVNADDLEMPEWPAGPAQLGYGDGDEATLTRDGGPPYPMTAYFRRRLDAPADLGAAALRLKLVRDDAAAVYLNGIELLRDNLPPGELTFETPATQAAGGDDENAWHTFEVAPHALRAGPNWIAVEVHQNSPASSDLSFDLELVARLDAPPPVKPLVSIRATVPETTEPSPEVRVQPGRFVISRTGSVDEPLAVVCEFGGTAAVGQDYLLEPTPESPFSTFTIPAGQETLEVLVGALDDLDSEGVETVVAELGPFPLPAGGVPGLAEEGAGPALEQPYVIDPDQARATVVIHDNDSPSVAELVILHPPPGVVWPAGETLPIDIVATDPDGYIARVEVFDRETRVGVSEINFFVAPPPGTRIDHHVEWENPPPGEHVLRAVAVDSAGERVVSEPVPFLVEPAFEQVVLTVTAPHPATAEPGPLVDPAPAAFVIERIAGPLDVKVPVYFQLGGTATGGKDYFELPRDLALEAGQSRLEIPVIAMPDEWAEGPESVVFELVPPECPAIYPPPPACYRVG
ncbi:MAG: hypothetical protein KDM81_15590, partial [Verrucomicrobiae bacterium]|nr:hypothetical protein [Verrucomicrobiae bacterium]